MKLTIPRSIIFTCEVILVYGILWYLSFKGIVGNELFFLLLCFSSLLFALQYGVQGAFISAAASFLLAHLWTKGNIFYLLSRYYIEASFFVSGIFLAGFTRSGIDRKVINAELSNQILDRRVESLTLRLSESDKALQEVLNEIITDMESPKIMYQAIRRIEQIDDLESFFNEILYILYNHCHVEKSNIYKPENKNDLKRVVSFGATVLPETLVWKTPDMPEILRVGIAEKAIIVPKEFSHRFVMAIPILSLSEKLLYIILIEEIRFINLSENILNLLKAAAFWIRAMIEERIHREEIIKFSMYRSVIVYKTDVSRKFLKETISFYKRYNLSFTLLEVEGEIREKDALTLSSSLRLFDELFMINDGYLIIFLSMTTEENASFVKERLKKLLPHLKVSQMKSKKSIFN